MIISIHSSCNSEKLSPGNNQGAVRVGNPGVENSTTQCQQAGKPASRGSRIECKTHRSSDEDVRDTGIKMLHRVFPLTIVDIDWIVH
jgi:hypothetical protein